jgi:CheY-like chemotaxis protein
MFCYKIFSLLPIKKGGNIKRRDKMKVLVVEDEAANIQAAKEAFASLGVDVAFASSLEEAEDLLAAQDFLAAIVDLNFPRRSTSKVPEKLGNVVSEILNKKGVPHLYVSSYLHGGRSWTKLGLFEFTQEIEKFFESKDNPILWQKVWNWLLDVYNLREVEAAKDRYERNVGKPFEPS